MRAEYIDHMGDDLMVVNAARVSFSKESEWGPDTDGLSFNEIDQLDFDKQVLKEQDQKLISYLATHGHWTPFSHPQITLRETVPIFVARQRFKHMVGFTYNEVSRRYVDDEPECFLPASNDIRERPEGSVKQGSGGEHPHALDIRTQMEIHNHECVRFYNNLLNQGVAPEQARMVLPQSMYTSYYVTGSLAAFARAYVQRIDEHAQKEIQDLAKQWDEIIRPLYPVSWEALTCQR